MVDRPALIEAETVLEQPYDASDPVQVNAARKKAGRKKRELLNFVAAVMEQKPGRAWMHDLLVFCHVFESPFVMGHPDGTAFRLGEQNIGLKLTADIQAAAPKEYVLMCEEAAGRV